MVLVNKRMIYLQAISQTIIYMGPHYLTNTYKWVKSALWDAPYRLFLDVELEKIAIERLSERDSKLNETDSE
jgi:hypothetical protein